MSNATVDNGRQAILKPVEVADFGVSFVKFAIVWLLSAVMNVGLIVVGLMIFGILGLFAGPPTDTGDMAVEEKTEVEDVEKNPDLTNTDIGLDDTLTTQYNVDRIEEVSVPGRVDPSAPV